MRNDRGVSPVIGVILMVAITVILASIIGVYVLGLADVSEPAPNAQFQIDVNDTHATVTHTNGAEIPARTLSFQGEGVETGNYPVVTGVPPAHAVAAGETATLNVSSDDPVIRVVWSDGESSSILAEYGT